jgi:hypothetical protein
MKITVRGKTIEFELGEKLVPLEFPSPLAAAQCFLSLKEAPHMKKKELRDSMRWGDLHEHFKNVSPPAPKDVVDSVLGLHTGQHSFYFPALGPLDEDDALVRTVCQLSTDDALQAALMAIPPLMEIATDLPQAVKEVAGNPHGELAQALSNKDMERAAKLLNETPPFGV